MRLPAYRCPCGWFSRKPEALTEHMLDDHCGEVDTGWRLRTAMFNSFYVEVCKPCDEAFETLAGYLIHIEYEHSTKKLDDVTRRTKRGIKWQ